MDASLLTLAMFWRDPAPFAAGDFAGALPDLPELRGHVLFETSGSTGTPKWIALSKEALLASAVAVNAHLGVTPSSRWGLALPARHVGGFGVAARAFAAGCSFFEMPGRWDAQSFAEWLESNRITHGSLVPTQVHDLVRAGLRAPGSLIAVVVGGGRLDEATGQAARALGWPVLASYGMTEAGSQIATQSLDSLHSTYRPEPLPLLPIWRAEVSPDDRLRISGPALFSGFLLPDAGGWRYGIRDSEWYETGDQVVIGDEGLTPLGRADSQVKVLGELVDPGLIERELVELSAGRLAPGSFVVVAIPEARAGHALVPVFDSATAREVIDLALAAYHETALGFRRLHEVVILKDFPRSSLGKPMRAEITARLASSA
jgi:o-succinylbenzoate---CoA ligase